MRTGRFIAPIGLIALLAAGCAGGGRDALNAEALPGGATAIAATDSPGVAPAQFSGLPAVPVADRAASQTALSMSGDSYLEGYSGISKSGSKAVLDAATGPGKLAWALYEFETTETAKYPTQFSAKVGAGSSEYWLGLADFSKRAWVFSGPYGTSGNMPAPGPQTGGGAVDYVSDGGLAYGLVVAFSQSGAARTVVDELELKLSANPPPAPPGGLSASVLPGSVRLDWTKPSAAGLLGYNVYFATQPFSTPFQSTVTCANSVLVPANSPSYEFFQLEPSRTYYMRVAAVAADQVESALSAQVIAATVYSLHIDEVGSPRQYPGFWVYVDGKGFDPAPGKTKAFVNGTALPAANVADVTATALRLRIPPSTAPEQELNVTVTVGGQTSNAYPIWVVDPSTPPRGWAHVGKTLYQSFEPYAPRGVAVGADGKLYVAQGGAGRIDVYGPGGGALRSYWLDDPRDIEVASDGRILVKQGGGDDIWWIEPGSGAVTRALSQAVMQSTFGGGQFVALSGGAIFVSDEEQGVVHKYVNGTETLTIGAGVLERPRDVELDGSGNIVVADDELGRVFWFSSSGGLLGSYRGDVDNANDTGELHQAWGLCIGADGSVLVGDRNRDRILRLTGARQYSGEWGQGGYADGQGLAPPDPLGAEGRFWDIWGLAWLDAERVLIADETDCRAGIYHPQTGVMQGSLGDATVQPGEFIAPAWFAVRPSDGAFAVLDDVTFCISVLSRRNALLDSAYFETGVEGDIFTGRMARHGAGLAWGADKLYFTHGYTQLTEYSDDFASYRVLATDWGSDPAKFKGCGSIACDGGALYAMDRENDRIQVFANGTYSRSIGIPNAAGNGPNVLALDAARGYIYVLDRPWDSASRVLRLRVSDGSLVDSFEPGFSLSGNVLALDPSGDVYVHYWGNGLLHRYRPPAGGSGAWEHVSDFLAYGDGDGQARNVQSLSITPDGRYLVSDSTRRQVVILVP